MKLNLFALTLCTTAAILGGANLAQAEAMVIMEIQSTNGGTGQVLATVIENGGMNLNGIVGRFGGQNFQISATSGAPFIRGLCHPFAALYPKPRLLTGTPDSHLQTVAIDSIGDKFVAHLVPRASSVIKSATCLAE